MESKNRVVVTGLGIVSPAGIGVEIFWDAVLHGKSTVKPISQFDPAPFPTRIASYTSLDSFISQDLADQLWPYSRARFVQMAVAAVLEALSMAKIDINALRGDANTAIIIGSSKGGIELVEKAIKEGLPPDSSLLAAASINAAALAVQRLLSVGGPVGAMVTACATGAHSIGEGFRLIQQGKAERVIAGSSEATITPLMLGAFSQLRALSRRNDEPEKASRPFDKDRDGFVMGEGSGIVLLESLDSALSRGVDILFEVVGYGNSSDAFHPTLPDSSGDGMALAMKKALEGAGLVPEQIDYINAHGTSTFANDIVETAAIKQVFGINAHAIPVSSIKSTIGHLMGAAGSIEFIAAGLSASKDLILPTINLENIDPQCDLDYVPNAYRKRDIRYIITNSFGFGGHNAVLVIKKCQMNLLRFHE